MNGKKFEKNHNKNIPINEGDEFLIKGRNSNIVYYLEKN